MAAKKEVPMTLKVNIPFMPDGMNKIDVHVNELKFTFRQGENIAPRPCVEAFMASKYGNAATVVG